MHEELNRALAKWVEILGIDPSAADAMNKIDWGYRTTIEQLEEAQKLDMTGLTTAMILYGIWESYAENLTISVRDMLDKNPESLKLIADYKELRNLISTPAIMEEMMAFQKHIKECMISYEAPQSLPIIDDLSSLGMLRRDALRSIENMQCYQFIQGTSVTEKMKYNKVVYQFPNIQSMISSIVSHSECGVSLCHILDAEGLEFSYFAFGVWNGGTMTVVSDKPNWAHPAQKRMTRCTGRQLSERWGQHHFPYDLLKPQFSSNTKNVTFGRREGLVIYNMEATAIHGLFNLEPDVVVWVAMVLELLQHRYFKENKLLSDLSYTSDQMQTQVPVNYPLMTLEGWVPPIKPWFETEKLSVESTASNWERQPVRHNEWLEKKFKGKVPSSLLNLVQDDTGKKLPPTDRKDLAIFKKLSNDLKAPAPTEFGSIQELQHDHEWVARYNQAVIVNELAKKEFQEKKESILTWYSEKVQARSDFLIDRVCSLTWPVQFERYKIGFTCEKENFKIDWIKPIYDTRGHFTDSYDYYRGTFRQTIGNYNRERDCYMCPLEGTKCTLSQIFQVESSEIISLIIGIPVEELPEPLQHYFTEVNEPYYGNQILDRLDPMDWVVQNPWSKLCLDVRVVLSKSGFNKRRNQLHLSKFRDWKSLEKKK
jgi:hypothetical protein